MIKKLLVLICLFFLFSCGGIELVLNERWANQNPYKNNMLLVLDQNSNQKVTQELMSFFGNNLDGEFILTTSFSEEKKNRFVKKNQVAEKISYKLSIDYKIYYKNRNCETFNKKIITKFSFVPKSFGYNFGSDISLEKLYKGSIRKNIQKFIDSASKNKTKNCL